ncbi:BPSS1780 family membrane protein [Aquabacterium sp.]|uniref:BPSS1780 family membrane protein n=1 Tax=Aquabacterium sp. TaxID=1872578 RepID=UPI003D6C7F0B
MKLRIMPARMGLTWMGHGLRACIRQPMGFVGLWGLIVCAAIITCEILAQIGVPALGPLLVVSLMPLVWMGFMLASRRVLMTQRVTPGVFLEPLRGQPSSMKWMWAKLGGAYLLATLLVMVLADAFGPGSDTLATAMKNAKETSDLVTDPNVQSAMLWQFMLTIPVSLVFWHTPALTYWAKLPLGKALFFSTIASWRNLGAFILFGAGWLGVAVVLILVNSLLAAVLGSPMLVNVLVTVGAMWMASAFYASLYFSVVDCFEPDDTSGIHQPVSRSTPSSGQA